MTIDGGFLSTSFAVIGPATVQLPALSQTWRLPVAALLVSAPLGTWVESENEASPGFARPDAESDAVHARVTSEACQCPSDEAQATVGAVASRMIVTELEAVPPPLVAVQVNVVPLVSEVTNPVAHPDVDPISD